MEKLDNPLWLMREYEYRSMQSIADELGVHRNTVRKRFIKFGIERRNRTSHFTGVPKTPEQLEKMSIARKRYWEDHPEKRVEMSHRTWKHGLDAYGYKRINIRRKAIKEHRFIMEQYLGRTLLPSEHIHHINGNKTDNRPENMTLLSPSEHSRLHGFTGSRNSKK